MSSTATTFIWRKYVGFVILVALTEKASLVIVYGKVASIVIVIDVFKVGFADIGTMETPDFVAAIIVSDRVCVTV